MLLLPKFRSLILLLLMLISSQGHAMGFFDSLKIYVFSDVKGVVTLNGQPVEGAELVRTADHEEDKVYTDKAVTNAKGEFSFPPISTYSLRPILMSTIVRQKLVIRYDGVEYLAWETKKKDNHFRSELNNEGDDPTVAIDLSCELTDPQDDRKIIKLKRRQVSIFGLCRIVSM